MALKNASCVALALLLSGCGGGSDLPPETPVAAETPAEAAPSVSPEVEAPAPEAASSEVEAVRTRALAALNKVDTLTRVEAAPDPEGDLTRTLTGFKDGDAFVVVTEKDEVGEYALIETRYVLEAGKPIYRERKGFTHDPIDGQDSRFKKFEEQVVVGEGGVALHAREKAAWTEGHPDASTKLPEDWSPVADVEKIDVSEALALFP